MYLYGEVDASGSVVNQYQYINLTVEALKAECQGQITCQTEAVSQSKKSKAIQNKNLLLRHGGVNLATRGRTVDNDEMAFKIEKKNDALSLYDALNMDKETTPRRHSQATKAPAGKITTESANDVKLEIIKRKTKFKSIQEIIDDKKSGQRGKNEAPKTELSDPKLSMKKIVRKQEVKI